MADCGRTEGRFYKALKIKDAQASVMLSPSIHMSESLLLLSDSDRIEEIRARIHKAHNPHL
jgi:hypothetical protein